jgi:DNA-binding response OmpR family regulator
VLRVVGGPPCRTPDREQRLVWVRGELVELSAMGFDLLVPRGRVFTRLELLEAVRGETYSGFERSIDSHIKRLRQKIEVDPARPEYILTVFGVGYRFAREGDG